MPDGTEMIIDTRTSSEACAALTNNALDGLAPGESFILVADHDPRGLHYMLDAERPGIVAWENLDEGPEVWRARISRIAAEV